MSFMLDLGIKNYVDLKENTTNVFWNSYEENTESISNFWTFCVFSNLSQLDKIVMNLEIFDLRLYFNL